MDSYDDMAISSGVGPSISGRLSSTRSRPKPRPDRSGKRKKESLPSQNVQLLWKKVLSTPSKRRKVFECFESAFMSSSLVLPRLVKLIKDEDFANPVNSQPSAFRPAVSMANRDPSNDIQVIRDTCIPLNWNQLQALYEDMVLHCRLQPATPSPPVHPVLVSMDEDTVLSYVEGPLDEARFAWVEENGYQEEEYEFPCVQRDVDESVFK